MEKNRNKSIAQSIFTNSENGVVRNAENVIDARISNECSWYPVTGLLDRYFYLDVFASIDTELNEIADKKLGYR